MKIRIKSITLVLICALAGYTLRSDTKVVDGITWSYRIFNGNALLMEPCVPLSTTGALSVPSSLDGYPVCIGNRAFYNCAGITSVVIPNGVSSIGAMAFSHCYSLESVTIQDSEMNIGDVAFEYCTNLVSVTMPNSVASITRTAFDGCDKLWAAWYPTIAKISADGYLEMTHVVTNVVVHYVTQSVPSAAVVPPDTTGIVNVISEVNAGAAVAITADWAAQYPDFVAKFGSDFTAAVAAETGKRDSAGKPMMVWQDFVAGTDPTNPDDVFRATITFDAVTGDPIISWTPELSAAEAAKRIYKIFGKARLNDPDWTLVNGDAANYNFFKVTVQMK